MNSELGRLTAHAEMMPAMRQLGGLMLSREGKQMMTRIREKYGEAVLAALDLEIARSIAERGMQNTSDLIDQAIRLAHGDEGKFQELVKIALAYGQVVSKVQRRQIDPFGL